jgi:hypothetical protein
MRIRKKTKVHRFKKGEIREQIWTKTDLLVALLSVLQVNVGEESEEGRKPFWISSTAGP